METNLETAILNALYDYFESHLGSPAMTLSDLYKAIGYSPNNKGGLRQILAQLSCLKGRKWVDYQAVEDGFGGLAWITNEGIRVAEDRRMLMAEASFEQSSEGEPREPVHVPSEPLSLEPEPNVPETVLIPAGFFWMGSPLDDPAARENEKPRHELYLNDYSIGRYPVTNAQYACFVLNTGHAPPEHWDEGKIPEGLEDHPVVNVTFTDAEAYCGWLKQVSEQPYRLPTEMEWEKAARGNLPQTRCYPWGAEWQPDICNTYELGQNRSTSVHEFEDTNISLFGAVDMAGNVWEWTTSWYNPYPNSPHDSLNYGEDYRVVRGGSWRSHRKNVRISCRGRYKPDESRPYLGFRVASTVNVGEA